MVYRSLYCVLTLIPAEQFDRTPSDNQWLTTLVRYDLSQFAIYHIVTFFVGNKVL